MNEQLIAEFKQFQSTFDTRFSAIEEDVERHKTMLRNIEQELSRPAGLYSPKAATSKSLADLLWESPDFQQWKKTAKGRMAIQLEPDQLKTITTSDFAATSSNFSSDRRSGIYAPPARRRRVREVLPNFPTAAGLVEYIRETAFTNAASPVAETISKPQSSASFAVEIAAVRTLAHVSPISRQAMDDIVAMRAYLGSRMTQKLLDIEDAELLTGDGTGQHLDGLTTVATDYAGTYNASGDTRIDRLSHALLELELREYNASGIILNPADWRAITLVKTEEGGTNKGDYIVGGPAVAGDQTLWGIPVATTTAMTQGFFLVGDFQSGTAVFDRMPPTVEISDSHLDYFQRNMLAVRVEERISLAVFQPDALCYGAF